MRESSSLPLYIRRLVVLLALGALPITLGLTFDALGLTDVGRPLGVLAVVPAALGLLCAAPLTLIGDRPATGWVGLHFVESVGLYLWLILGAMMQGEGLTARGGVFFGAAALGGIVANAVVLRRGRSGVAAA